MHSLSRRSCLAALPALGLVGAGCQSGGGSALASSRGQVEIFEQALAIPQLGRTRTIRLYLPSGYRRSTQSYRVLYMMDGQNLFDAATSFAGEWRVDETLDQLAAQGDPGAIVIGIDNGGAERAREYHRIVPGGSAGQADAFVQFLCDTLKPLVDARLRTRRGPQDTMILGASSGATLALMAGFTRPDVFGQIGALSAPLWLEPSAELEVKAVRPARPWSRLVCISGQTETVGDLRPGIFAEGLAPLRAAALEAGYDSRQLWIEPDPVGQHNEAFWARLMAPTYRFLTSGST